MFVLWVGFRASPAARVQVQKSEALSKKSGGCPGFEFRNHGLWRYFQEELEGGKLSQPDVGRQYDNRFRITVQRNRTGAEHWVGGGEGFAHPELSKTHTRTSGVSEVGFS